jgi:hypothetical protein
MVVAQLSRLVDTSVNEFVAHVVRLFILKDIYAEFHVHCLRFSSVTLVCNRVVTKCKTHI